MLNQKVNVNTRRIMDSAIEIFSSRVAFVMKLYGVIKCLSMHVQAAVPVVLTVFFNIRLPLTDGDHRMNNICHMTAKSGIKHIS